MTWHSVERPFREPFAIARGVASAAPLITVELSDGVVKGRGEAYPVDYAGESLATMGAALDSVRSVVEAGATRADLLSLLPPGGARCALDAALWDLEAKRGGADPFAANGVGPSAVTSARTIGIRDIAAFERTARAWSGAAVLKVKVDGREPIAAIEAVRRGAPDARLIVDANQGWTVDQTRALAPRLATLGVALLEQPIPVGDEAGLDDWTSPIPLCADELIDDEADLTKARGRFAYVNIKLEKAGGLTAAMRLARAAQAQGFGLMVGCMGGTSLSMAPGMVLAQLCDFVDLDGPLFLTEDLADGFDYREGAVAEPHRRALWG